MKCLMLSISIITLLSGANTYAQQDDVRGALLGNNPKATITTGIGQVVEPVGTPVVKPLIGTPTAAPPPSSTTSGPSAKKSEKSREFKYKTIYDYYEKEDVKEGEVPKKQTKDEKTLRKEAIQRMILSNETIGSSRGNIDQPKTVPIQNTKPKEIRIPYSEPPPVQRVPYNY